MEGISLQGGFVATRIYNGAQKKKEEKKSLFCKQNKSKQTKNLKSQNVMLDLEDNTRPMLSNDDHTFVFKSRNIFEGYKCHLVKET